MKSKKDLWPELADMLELQEIKHDILKQKEDNEEELENHINDQLSL